MIEKDVSKLEKLLDLFSVLSMGSVIIFVMVSLYMQGDLLPPNSFH
jgi:hypothetical protein